MSEVWRNDIILQQSQRGEREREREIETAAAATHFTNWYIWIYVLPIIT
jgi:hypothetical protein